MAMRAGISCTGPGRVNFDFSLFKEFRIKEGVRLQFRTEIFNVVQHGAIRSAERIHRRGQAGTITSIVGTPRQIQFGLKFLF